MPGCRLGTGDPRLWTNIQRLVLTIRPEDHNWKIPGQNGAKSRGHVSGWISLLSNECSDTTATEVTCPSPHRPIARIAPPAHPHLAGTFVSCMASRFGKPAHASARWLLRRLRPLLHWRALRIIRHSPQFDADWYLAQHPELVLFRYDPALHYLVHGARLQLDPGPDFSTENYLRAHPTLAKPGNPLLHYEHACRAAPAWPAILAADVAAGRARLAALLPSLAARHQAAAEFRGESGEEGFSPAGSLAMVASAGRPVSVVILGRHSPDWMEALGPGGAVWHLLPEVARVSITEADPAPALATDAADGLMAVVIPLMEAHARLLGPAVPALNPPPALIDLLADKLVFDLYAARRLAEARPEHIASAEALRFPCVVKHAGLNAGRGAVVAHNEPEFTRAFTAPDLLGQPKTVQAAVPGDSEWVTHAVMRDGQLLWHASFEYRMPPGIVIRRPELPTPMSLRPTRRPVLAFLRELGAQLRYDGPLNLDYRLTGGRLSVFEVNPRLGGSLMRPEHVEHLAAALRAIIDAALVTPLAAIIEHSPLFSPGHYVALSHPQLAEGTPAALARHYLLHGGHTGRDPGPGFSSRDYRTLNPGQVPPEASPLLHYELFGRARGLAVQEPVRRQLAVAAHRLAALPTGPRQDRLRLVPAAEAARLVESEGLMPAGEVLHYSWELERFHERLFLLEAEGRLAVFAMAGQQYHSTPLPLFTTPPAPPLVLAERGRHLPFWYLQLAGFEAFLARRSAVSRAPKRNFPSLETWRAVALEQRFRLDRLPLSGNEAAFAGHFTRLKNPRLNFDGETCLRYYRGAARPAPAGWFAIYLLEDLAGGPPPAIALTIEQGGAATLLNLATSPGMGRPLLAMLVQALAKRGCRAVDAGVSGHFGTYKAAFFLDRRETDATGLPILPEWLLRAAPPATLHACPA